ncbi:hypothetical protein AURDEDRAFT_154461 [Auricularia subglabra TFB-10046 SS5]|uniref:F-box domain-containing protein n=1 Tax=Auricularia subglabra (strain TFB-10046 / SS5) TaxID=717982 RepID=J0LGT7_AURST|nr:hypothetical protein AURDEDRAFT_154461 [Auricularia subglabra TFB-10046 SS5]
MSRKRTRLLDKPAGRENWPAAPVLLPNELLLEVWDYLAPLERVSISQTCRAWRNLSLGVPKFWAQVALVLSAERVWIPAPDPLARPRARRPHPQPVRDIYHPAPDADNLYFFGVALLRSGNLPLDVSVICERRPSYRLHVEPFRHLVESHIHRIARLHFSGFDWVSVLWNTYWPVLRMLTVGFDDRLIVFPDLPRLPPCDSRFPVLRQIHFGSPDISFDNDGTFFQSEFFVLGFPSVSELTITPTWMSYIGEALEACPCVSSLTLVLSDFDNPPYRTRTDEAVILRLTRVRRLCISGISSARESFVLTTFNDERLADITLDYQGRPRKAGATWYRSLPSPCGVLSDPLHVNLTAREGLYELEVIDSAQRRRDILLDESTIARAPPLWDAYIRGKVVHSAAVDARAWAYFAADVPAECPLSTLSITVGYEHEELDAVSLAPFGSVTRLRVDTLQPGTKFAQRAVQRLVRSRPQTSEPLASLSLARNCDFGIDGDLAKLADVLERH